MQGLAHDFKLLQDGGNKLARDHPFYFIFRGHVIFLHFIGLLKEPLLHLNEVPVIPVKEGNLALRMRDFANDSHLDKVVNRSEKAQPILPTVALVQIKSSQNASKKGTVRFFSARNLILELQCLPLKFILI